MPKPSNLDVLAKADSSLQRAEPGGVRPQRFDIAGAHAPELGMLDGFAEAASSPAFVGHGRVGSWRADLRSTHAGRATVRFSPPLCVGLLCVALFTSAGPVIAQTGATNASERPDSASGRVTGADRTGGPLTATPSSAAPMAAPSTATPSTASASMQQVIEAARRKKALEVDAAARRMLGAQALPAPTGPSAGRSGATAPAAATPPTARPAAPPPPRLWSLSGVNGRWRAEVLMQGRIETLRSDALPDRLGAWKVRTLTAEGLTLERPAAPRARRTHTMHLPPPARGRDLAHYPLGQPGASLAGLAPSAARAAALPFADPTGTP